MNIQIGKTPRGLQVEEPVVADVNVYEEDELIYSGPVVQFTVINKKRRRFIDLSAHLKQKDSNGKKLKSFKPNHLDTEFIHAHSESLVQFVYPIEDQQNVNEATLNFSARMESMSDKYVGIIFATVFGGVAVLGALRYLYDFIMGLFNG